MSSPHKKNEEPSWWDFLGGLVVVTFILSLSLCAIVGQIDNLQDVSYEWCAKNDGLASRQRHINLSDFIYYDIVCIDGTKHRINGKPK